MKRGTRVALAALAALLAAAPASAQAADGPLDAYRVKATGTQVQELAGLGYDMTEGRSGNFATVVATKTQASGLRAKGFDPELIRDSQGRTERQRAAALRVECPDGAGFRVFRPYAIDAFDADCDPVDNLSTELGEIAAEHPQITKLVTIGHSVNGVPILAMKVTKNAQSTPDGQRPSTLFIGAQHAREWLTPENNRRLLHMFVDNYGGTGAAENVNGDPVAGISSEELTQLVNTREIWFVLVANPDGYDYTFESEDTRLWRKNLRDNNGDGEITSVDGVDPNRNFPVRWGYDNEGSSPDPSSETYRGTGPASEPETQAMIDLFRRAGFEMLDNVHTFGPLILYPEGWQVDTRTADDPIFRALSGDDADPAIPGYDPGPSAELYTTNGDTDDTSYHRYDVLSWTTELNPGDPEAEEGAGGFVFQDVDADIETEFQKALPFELDLVRSSADPDDPVSHQGNVAEPIEVFKFGVSYGSPQVVQATAKRSLGPVTMQFRIGNGEWQSVPTTEFKGGERYAIDDNVYYRRVRGTVTGAQVGDQVTVRFTAGDVTSQSFTYDQEADSGNPVLILAAENYSGGSGTPYASTTQPNHLSAYTAALDALGVGYDVYDVDAHDMTAPDALGVLGHYKAVIWYTAGDYITRIPGQGGGTGAAKVANDLVLAVRDFINEGGKLLLMGRNSGEQYFEAYDYSQTGEPVAATINNPDAWQPGFCDTVDQELVDECVPLSDDFFQYYLGGYIYVAGGGLSPDGVPFDVVGVQDPFTGAAYEMLTGTPITEGNANVTGNGTAVVTSSILPPDEFPQFASTGVLEFVREFAAPYDPYSGAWDLYSGSADQSYKRFGTTLDLAGQTSASLDWQMSYDTEVDWDYVFVEVAPVGTDDWTTLPISSGGEVVSGTDPGHSCADDGSHWSEELHPQLVHYMTVTGDDTCDPTGTTGEWNALTGNSAGWQPFSVDLSDYAGEEIQVNIVYAQDWATSGLGVFLDDVKLTVGGTVVSTQGFESEDLSPWSVLGPPEGTENNSADWHRTQDAFDEAPGIRTADSYWFTFGLEGLANAADRQDLLRRALTDFGVLNPGGQTPPGQNPGQGGGNPNPGAGKPKGGSRVVRVGRKAVRVNRKRIARFKVWCPPTSGSTCRGLLRAVTGHNVVARRSFAVAGDRWRPVRMRVTKRDYRKLVKRGRLKVTLVLTSRADDAVLRRDQARITLLAPKKK